MLIDITKIANADTPWRDYSASAFELGQDAGRVTWQAACDDAPDYALFPESDCDEVRAHFREYGAWDTDELAAMDHGELQALLLQFIAGDVREVRSDHDEFSVEWWEDYETQAEAGRISGQLMRGDDGSAGYWIGV